MSDRFWPDAKVSIVLLPSGEQGEALLELAAEWTKMGLMSPALWVLPKGVNGGAVGPPRITAVVLGVASDLEIVRVQVDVFEALAREALNVVRLVKLRSAAPSREYDEEQDSIADRVREYVVKSMPNPNPAAAVSDRAAELSQVTLICAPTEFQLQQRVNWAASEYGSVVVAAPEDRSSPWSGDAFVRDDTRFVGFALLHLASVAGLWSGVPTGSFELERREESGHRSVWLSRVFVNAVLTESLGRRTAARVLAEAARPDSLLVDPSVSSPPVGTAFIDDSQVSGYVDEMVRGALSLDDGALLFRKPDYHDDPPKRRVGLWLQVGRFVAFGVDKLAKMPMWSWRWITSRAYRSVTRTLHSDEGAEVVDGAYEEVFDARERAILRDAERIRDDEARARAEAEAPAGLSHVRTTPALWARLRELVFGSLDGSADLSTLGFAPVEDVVPIFGRVSDVLALPNDPWIPPRTVVPLAFPSRVDWYAIALLDPREQLVDAVAASTARRLEAQQALDEAVRELDDAERSVPIGRAVSGGAASSSIVLENAEAAVREGSAESSVAGDAAEQPIAQESALHRAVTAAAKSRVDGASATIIAASDEVERYSESVRQYDAWAVSHDGSFVFKLLTRLAAQRRGASQHAEDLAAQIDQISIPQPGELVQLRRRFHKKMLVATIVGLIVATLIVIGAIAVTAEVARNPDFVAEPWYAALWVLMGITVGAFVAAVLAALISYHVGWSRFQRRIVVQRHQLGQLGRNARTARQEAARLSSLHRQTVDWLVLLSRAIHRPWVIPESWLAREESTVVRDSMPFALQIATVKDDDHAAATRLRGAMTSHLVVKGWRHAAFESLVQEVANERGALTSSFGLHSLDDDLPHASNHTRKMLLSALDDESILTRIAGPRLESLVQAAQRSETRGSRPRVEPVVDNPLSVIVRGGGRLGETSGVPWDDFLVGSLAGRRDPITPLNATALTDVELGERHHERVQSFIVLPERLTAGFDYPAGTPVRIVPIRDERGAAVELSWRVDIAGPVPIKAIHLWDDSTIEQDAPETSTHGTSESGV